MTTTTTSRTKRAWLLAIRWVKRAAVAVAVLLTAAALGGYLLVRHYEADLPSVAELERGYHPSQVTRILARDGSVLAELFTERRTLVHIEDLPPQVKLAVLAAEDANFYNHEGINYFGIARAFVVNLRSGRMRQGGSTITQQVIKNILLDPQDKTYRRKMREALLARRLEQELCPSCGSDEEGKRRRKDKILELYLNHIYFGSGRYGIEEAAKYNFGKSARALTVAEAALLAGIVASPESYSPRHDAKRALTRRAFVLGQMHEKGFLNDAQYETANDEPLNLSPTQEVEGELAPEAVSIAKKMLFELDPQRAAHGGFTITTTIDPRMQAATRKALRENLSAYDKRHALLAPFKAPAPAQKGKRAAHAQTAFEGTPSFDSHKVYVGVVTGHDDVVGTLDVRVGSVLGSVKLADYKRYNPENLPPSQFAEVDARLRVSLLAPVAPDKNDGSDKSAHAMTKVPLRLELGPESAMVMLDVRTRQVLALVGSYEGGAGGLDRATQSRRQPGSTFKPIVYSYAIHSRRYTPATLVDVQPATFAGGYKPSNYEGYQGTDPLRLREVLANSVNIGAVRVLEDVGPANVVAWAQALGIRSTLKPDLSLALGSYELHPIELAGAYATFAAGGSYEEPSIVTRIVDPDGRDVALKALPPLQRVLEPAEAFVTTSMLESVIDHGTGARAKVLARPVAGKTGTSNESKDTWFAGYSTEITAVVWVGYDDNKPLGSGESGAQTALPAWIATMKAAHEAKPRAEFSHPEGVVVVPIDPKTGKHAAQGAEGSIDEVFLEGTEPSASEEDGDASDAGDTEKDGATP
ncbi:MAG: PBP1A family penicillin-binding protein [Polyangiaceae bacterium]|nr:PBP1A family penicillin-binding protein [Polyangiaceae bacterium]